MISLKLILTLGRILLKIQIVKNQQIKILKQRNKNPKIKKMMIVTKILKNLIKVSKQINNKNKQNQNKIKKVNRLIKTR